MTKTMSSDEFIKDAAKAKEAASNDSVIITEQGEPAYVFLSYDIYRRLLTRGPNIGELLDLPGTEDVEFDPPRLGRLSGSSLT